MPTPDSTAAVFDTLRLSPASFRRFADFINQELGIKMSEEKIPMLQARLQRRIRVLGLRSIDAYQEFLFGSPQGEAELGDFIDAVTTNKTDFFREPGHFDHLTKTALPSLDPGSGSFWHAKLWCAGCSSGEEPYTLSMVLSEFGAVRGQFDFSLLATDVSTRVLAAAREAIYPEDRIDPVPEALRRKYLLRSRAPGETLVRIAPELRSRVHFHRLNFMDSDYRIGDVFDAIFFRNVMIYFAKPTQEAVINRLCRHLRPGGYLYIGHSESLLGLEVPLSMVGSAIYRKRPAASHGS